MVKGSSVSEELGAIVQEFKNLFQHKINLFHHLTYRLQLKCSEDTEISLYARDKAETPIFNGCDL